jgi:hypothetical protein
VVFVRTIKRDNQTKFYLPDDDENPFTNLEAFFGEKYD